MADAGASAADTARVLKLAAGIWTEDESASLKALKDDIATVRKVLTTADFPDRERVCVFSAHIDCPASHSRACRWHRRAQLHFGLCSQMCSAGTNVVDERLGEGGCDSHVPALACAIAHACNIPGRARQSSCVFL